MRRVVELNTASQQLKLRYTYDIVPVETTKRNARFHLGSAASEALDVMILELENVAIDTYIRARKLERETDSLEKQASQEKESCTENRKSAGDTVGDRENTERDNEPPTLSAPFV